MKRIKENIIFWRMVGIVSGSVLIFTVLAVVVHYNYTLGFDRAVLEWVNSFSTPVLDILFSVGTEFGGIAGVAVLTGGFTALLVNRRKYAKATIMALTVGVSALLSVILKLLVERVRPDLWEQLIVETSFSFPSGHAIASSALALSVIVIFWQTKWRGIAIATGVIFTLFIGISRLYLGVHYPTDIVGGWLVSICTVAVIYYLVIHYLPKSLHWLFK